MQCNCTTLKVSSLKMLQLSVANSQHKLAPMAMKLDRSTFEEFYGHACTILPLTD